MSELTFNLPEDTDAEPCEQVFMLQQEDFDRFARLSGDHNPIHTDPGFSAQTPFGRTVSHGMLLFSALRGLLEERYPGARLLSQSLMFPAPAYADEALTLTVERQHQQGNRLGLSARILRPDGECCLQGSCELALTEARP
ncbi:MaoC family dehydratase [Salinarimonas sp. NSM]|uniref:MaoC family dehydratase n=1 Tax=Salinarimonas sp. NSM TaxID=3458003 RepID=UPI004035FDBF